MKLTRRDFMKAMSALAGAAAVQASGLGKLAQAATHGPPVIWLQGQGCTGCSVSLLNTIQDYSIDEVLLNLIDMEFHPNVMASAGDLATGRAMEIQANGGYILAIEGAIPTGSDGALHDYCHIWEDMTILQALQQFGPGADAILSVGTCSSYGGIPAANPNPTGAMGVEDAFGYLGINKNNRPPIINLPGCPSHPDWIVGSIAVLLSGNLPELDREGRPEAFYGNIVHKNCPNKGGGNGNAKQPGDLGCFSKIGCEGRQTHSDCSVRGWNAGEKGGAGTNWCVQSRFPCHGCTEPDFPDGRAPFVKL